VKKEGVTLEKTNETERQNEGGNVKSKTTDFRTKTLILKTYPIIQPNIVNDQTNQLTIINSQSTEGKGGRERTWFPAARCKATFKVQTLH